MDEATRKYLEDSGQSIKTRVTGKPSKRKIPEKDSNTIFVPCIRGVGASLSEQFDTGDGRAGKSATEGVADFMAATVEEYESKGYEFQRIETVHVDVSPGCIGMLLGKGTEYHPYDYFVFKKLPQPMSEGAAMLNS